MDIKKKIDEKLFPDLSFFDRAVKYPYPAPNYSFSFSKGQFKRGIHHRLDERIPILSVGSNRAPIQLQRKFSFEQDISVTPAILYDSDVCYAASISSYGSIPATQWPSIGTTVELNVLWLTREQLELMHLTEAVGVAYDFVKMKPGTVKIKDFEFNGNIYGYVSIPGVFPFELKKPKRLKEISGSNINLKAIDEETALISLMNLLEPNQHNLYNWIWDIINNRDYRITLHEKLKLKALKPIDPNWEIVNVKIKGSLTI